MSIKDALVLFPDSELASPESSADYNYYTFEADSSSSGKHNLLLENLMCFL